VNAYEQRKSEMDAFQARFEIFQSKILELQSQINKLEQGGDFESADHDALCYMQSGLQSAMQKEHDLFYGS